MLIKTPLWRQTPPAVFPVCLGFMSLALGWRAAADQLEWLSEDIGDLMLAASTGYFLWFFGFYLVKLTERPMVLLEDMRSPAARAGIAARGIVADWRLRRAVDWHTGDFISGLPHGDGVGDGGFGQKIRSSDGLRLIL